MGYYGVMEKGKRKKGEAQAWQQPSCGGEWRPFVLQAHRYFLTFYLRLSFFLFFFFLFLLPCYLYRTFMALCQSLPSLFAIILISKSWKRRSIYPRNINQWDPSLTETHLHNHAHQTPLWSMTCTWHCSPGDSLCDVQAMLLIFAFTALKFRKKHSQRMS